MSTIFFKGKAKIFEPLITVVDWLIDNPNTDWSLKLEQASQIKKEQMWRY